MRPTLGIKILIIENNADLGDIYGIVISPHTLQFFRCPSIFTTAR